MYRVEHEYSPRHLPVPIVFQFASDAHGDRSRGVSTRHVMSLLVSLMKLVALVILSRGLAAWALALRLVVKLKVRGPAEDLV